MFRGTYHVAIDAGDGYVYDSGRAGLPVQKRKDVSGLTSYGRVGLTQAKPRSARV